jgi:hypothetical protein
MDCGRVPVTLPIRVALMEHSLNGPDSLGDLLGFVAPSVLDPSDGVFGRFDLVALCGCHTLNVCLFVCIQEVLRGIIGGCML